MKGTIVLITLFVASAAVAAQPTAPQPVSAPSSTIYKDTIVNQAVSGPITDASSRKQESKAVVVEMPKHGRATTGNDPLGTWTYQPDRDFSGHDEFRISTSAGGATRVVILVSAPPKRRTIYVDATCSIHGSDKGDGSKERPFASIQAAHNVTHPGDTVLIRAGTYTESSNEAVLSVSRSGLPGAFITYKAFPGEHPVLHTAVAWNIVLITASYIRIEGLEIAGNAANVSIEDAAKVAERFMQGGKEQTYGPETSAYETNGVSIRPANQREPLDRMISPRHVEVTGNYVHDCQGGGISAQWSDYIDIWDNRIERTSVRAMYATSGISLLGLQNTDFDKPDYKDVIAGNTLRANETKVVWAKIKKMSDGNGIILDSNRNESPVGAPYTGRILVANNIVSDNGGAGIQVFATDNVDVLFNTVYRNSVTPGLRYGQIWCHQASNIRVLNNIAVAGDGAKINEVFKDTKNVVYDYNIYFGGLPPQIVGPHDIIADPKLVDASARNFALTPGSPAIDSALPGFALKKDNAGHIRPFGRGPDRGALEWQGK